jgi:hypothetical protein
LGTAVLVLCVFAAPACSAVGSNAVDHSADVRAHRAGIVMLRVTDGTAADRARRVVGGDPRTGTAIEALVAEGGRSHGRVVLRITERLETAELSAATNRTVRCYEYRFDNSIDDDEHQRRFLPTSKPNCASNSTRSTAPSSRPSSYGEP